MQNFQMESNDKISLKRDYDGQKKTQSGNLMQSKSFDFENVIRSIQKSKDEEWLLKTSQSMASFSESRPKPDDRNSFQKAHKKKVCICIIDICVIFVLFV